MGRGAEGSGWPQEGWGKGLRWSMQGEHDAEMGVGRRKASHKIVGHGLV